MMKILTGIFLVILAAATAVATVTSYRAWNELREIDAAIHEKVLEVEDVRTRTGEVNLRYRALMEGMSSVPDSLKLQLTGDYQRRAESFRKQLYKLEREGREAARILNKGKRAESAARENLHRKLMVLGGAAVLLLAGVVWRARAIRS
jgi:hypothetical protein